MTLVTSDNDLTNCFAASVAPLSVVKDTEQTIGEEIRTKRKRRNKKRQLEMLFIYGSSAWVIFSFLFILATKFYRHLFASASALINVSSNVIIASILESRTVKRSGPRKVILLLNFFHIFLINFLVYR